MSVRILTPPFLGSYANIHKPRKDQKGKEKYSIAMLFDKKTNISRLKKAIQEVGVEKFGPKAKFASPLRDGDIEKPEDKTYAGMVFCNARSDRKPGIVDAKAVRVFEEGDAYSGCTFRASVSVYAYEMEGKKGVALGLNNLQVLKKGPRLDSQKSAEDEFKDLSVPEVGGSSEDDLSDIG
jgi:hypothetical protein